jgi:hypothetical protein
VARKMYQKMTNVPILIKYGRKVTDPGPMFIDKKQYSHREHDPLSGTKQIQTKIILWCHNTENIKKL